MHLTASQWYKFGNQFVFYSFGNMAISLRIFFTSVIFLQLVSVLSAQRNNACTKNLDYLIRDVSHDCSYNPDVLSDVLTMATRHGYRGESLRTTTEDGYILTVFRIFPKEGSDSGNKPPIFIQHGIATNSGPWADKGNRSMAYVLADQGHEVFLGNIRGTTYSKHHVTLKAQNGKFWDFNLDTLSEFDVRAQLNLVANITGQGGKIVYIGHSMGTTLFFMYGSAFPQELNSLVQGGIMLAPIVYLKNNPALNLATPLVYLLDALGLKNVFLHEAFVHNFANFLCPLIPDLCRWLQFISLGKSNQFLPQDLLLYYSNWPSTTAVKQFVQYLQMYNSQKLQKFDFGAKKNTNLYGSSGVPVYDLSKFTTPVYLFYGNNDALTDEQHVTEVYNQIGSDQKVVQSIPKNNASLAFSHLDFLYAEFLQEFLYDEIIAILETKFT